MAPVEILNAARDSTGGYMVDMTRGARIGRVSSEWFSRPADERYLSLLDLFAVLYTALPSAAALGQWRAGRFGWRRAATILND